MTAVRFLPHSRMLGLLVLAAGCALLLGPVTAQEPPAKGKDARPAPSTSSRDKEFQVIPLKHAAATEVARVIQEMFRNERAPAVTLGVDERTNALVVSGATPEVDKVRELVSRLDTAREDEGGRLRMHVFQLQSIEPDKAVEDALKLIVNTAGGGYSVDKQRKMVVISADERTQRTVAELLARMDSPPSGDRPHVEAQVRVIWLVNGLAREDAPNPPDDLKEVLAELAKLGIDKPRLAAQTVVTARPDVPFQALGVAKLDTPCEISVGGTVRAKDQVTVQLTLNASRKGRQGPEPLCQLSTEITAPPGHFVVLGVTPTETMMSAFVVQVTGKAHKRPGQK